jgi:hypothetical protein
LRVRVVVQIRIGGTREDGLGGRGEGGGAGIYGRMPRGVGSRF